jgi:hypothetical protein
MRHACSCALAWERFISLRTLHTRAWTVVSLLGLLVSQEAVASNSFHSDSLIPRERISPQRGPSSGFEEGPDSSFVVAVVEAGPSNLYSEAFWDALADLDLATSRKTARSDAETEFARAMELLTAGSHLEAENAFANLSTYKGDLNVAVAAQMMLAHTLLYERKWSRLRDLPENSALGASDQQTTSDLERWGHAFANIEPQSTVFPTAPVSLPMRVTAVGTPSIRVKINGKEYEFWLDTGSTMTVLSSEVADATQVPIISADTLKVRTFGGHARVRPALVRKLQVGPIVITNSPAIVIDASMMRLQTSSNGAPWAGEHVDGILGWDFIRQFNVVLNYQTGKATFATPEELGVNGTDAQNLTWAGEPLVEVRSKSGATLHFSLDTGAQSTFINATVLEKMGATTRVATGRVSGIARTGAPTRRVVPTLTVKVGRKSLRLEDVVVYGPSYSGLIGCDGILGSDLARFGAIRIDATNGIFSVGPEAESV